VEWVGGSEGSGGGWGAGGGGEGGGGGGAVMGGGGGGTSASNWRSHRPPWHIKKLDNQQYASNNVNCHAH